MAQQWTAQTVNLHRKLQGEWTFQERLVAWLRSIHTIGYHLHNNQKEVFVSTITDCMRSSWTGITEEIFKYDSTSENATALKNFRPTVDRKSLYPTNCVR